MTREYDRQLDSKKGIKLAHTNVRRLITEAATHMDRKDFYSLENVYLEIESVMSSLGESARVLQEKQEEGK
jgi:hypothetical protein